MTDLIDKAQESADYLLQQEIAKRCRFEGESEKNVLNVVKRYQSAAVHLVGLNSALNVKPR